MYVYLYRVSEPVYFYKMLSEFFKSICKRCYNNKRDESFNRERYL